MDRVSVPLWLTVLSDQLSVFALVGFYPTNKLMERRLIPKRPKPLIRRSHPVLPRLSPSYPELRGRFLRVTHPFAANPVRYCYRQFIAQLACLIHAASVRSEPESNSPKRKYVVFAGKPAMTNILTGNGVPTFKHSFYRAPHRFKRAVRNAQISFFNFLSILLKSED